MATGKVCNVLIAQKGEFRNFTVMRAVLIYTIVAIAGGLAISALGQEKSRGKGKPSAVAKAPAESAEAAEEDWNIPVTLGKDGWMI